MTNCWHCRLWNSTFFSGDQTGTRRRIRSSAPGSQRPLTPNRAGWICDGNYTSKVPDLILPQADLVIWLRLPFVVVYWRLLTRTVRRVWTEETL